jgi:hypothetical protein
MKIKKEGRKRDREKIVGERGKERKRRQKEREKEEG